MSETDEPVKIAVSNQKGGVGKTAAAINTAAALANRDHNVLLADVDPQGNATENLDLMDAYDATPPSLFDVLTTPDDRDAVTNLVVEHSEMDVLPSNIDMTAAEPELTLARRGAEQLDLALQRIESDYDYIIIDCPPNLGNLTDNAIVAAQNILVPALAEATSMRAFELLNDHITSLERDFEIAVDEVGVIINRIDVRKNQANEMIDWIHSVYDDVPVWEVRERAAIQKAMANGESLLAHAPDSDMAYIFKNIAASLDRQFDRAEEVAP